jgi:hypothetical protein
MKVVHFKRDPAAEFSLLYLHLLQAALDEANPSTSSEARTHNLAAHVAWGISMSGFDTGAFGFMGSGHGEATFL